MRCSRLMDELRSQVSPRLDLPIKNRVLIATQYPALRCSREKPSAALSSPLMSVTAMGGAKGKDHNKNTKQDITRPSTSQKRSV